ncbi:MAG: VOC family protein [Verrucomicrobiota bacterium]
MKLAHICLRVEDIDRMESFLCADLGFEHCFDFTKDGGRVGYYLTIGNNEFIEVFRVGSEDEVKPGMIDHFCLECDDIEKVHIEISQKTWPITSIKKGCDQSFQFWVTGPEGLRVEFHQYTKESSQQTKRSVEVDW